MINIPCESESLEPLDAIFVSKLVSRFLKLKARQKALAEILLEKIQKKTSQSFI